MDDKELNIVEHLEELRKRLIIIAIFFIASFIVGFIYIKDIYHWFVKDLDVKLIALGPSDILWVYIMLSTIVAVAITIPIAAWQIWLFVKPALKPEERKTSLTFIPFLFILFLAGLSFGYFVILPMVLHFLAGLGADMLSASYTAENYFRFIFSLTIPFGILFELPIVILFLTFLGILTPYFLQKTRKYAYFLLVVMAIIITPPDFLSDALVSIPLLVLYEISISLSKIAFRRKQRKENL